MDKVKYLLKNIGFLTISNFSTKMISFLLIPLYTSILSTYDYGVYDLVSTTISLLVPLVTCNIVDATLRFSIDEIYDTSEVLVISIKYFLYGIAFILLIILMNHWLLIFPVFDKYVLFFFLLYVFYALQGILSAFGRGIDKVKETSIAGAVGSVATIILNIVFLVLFQWGIRGYFAATVAGYAVQVLYLWIALGCWKYFVHLSADRETERRMICFSGILIVNNIAWWVNNASDRYVVTFFCGMAQNGIYSVAYKLPSVMSVLQSIFQQAWMLSAVKEYDKEDRNGFYSNVYESYGFFLVLICASIILLNRLIARYLYADGYYSAWKYVPFLTIGFVFSAMANYLGGIFQAVRQPKIIAASTTIGAAVNIILDIFLTKRIGAIGAALATSISYAIVWQVRVFVVRKYMDIKIHWLRDYFIYLLLYAQAVVNIYFCRVVPKLSLINIGVVVLVIVLYRNIMIEILQKAGISKR